jgi:hypothetical protein
MKDVPQIEANSRSKPQAEGGIGWEGGAGSGVAEAVEGVGFKAVTKPTENERSTRKLGIVGRFLSGLPAQVRPR